MDKCVTSLLIFAAVGYVIWLRLFVILRYLVILEGISAIFVVWALRKLPVVWKNCFLAGLLVLFSFTTVYPDWGTEPFAEKVLVFDDFQDVPDQSLILVQTQALSYVLPFFNQTATFVGGLQVVPEDYPPPLQRRAFLRNQLMPAFYHYHFERDVQHKIDTHQGPIYLLTYYWDHALYPTALARWGVKGDICQCHRFTTSWNKYFEDMILCPLEKI